MAPFPCPQFRLWTAQKEFGFSICRTRACADTPHAAAQFWRETCQCRSPELAKCSVRVVQSGEPAMFRSRVQRINVLRSQFYKCSIKSTESFVDGPALRVSWILCCTKTSSFSHLLQRVCVSSDGLFRAF